MNQVIKTATLFNNLHISLTEFRNESRVLKETNSLLSYGVVDKVYIASLYADNLEEKQVYSNNVRLNRFRLSSRRFSKNLFVQILKYLEFVIRIIHFYKNKNIKMVNIHSIALLPLGLLLKYLYGAKLIYDTHELETEKNGLKGMRKKFAKLIEKTFIKKVDLVFVVSEKISDWYAKEYDIKKPEVVLNAPKLFAQKKTNKFREKFNIKENSIILLYQGGLTKGRGIELLLNIFKLRDNDDLVVVFMGYGELEEDIINASINSKKIFFHPAVSSDIVLEYTSSADIGISFIENTCLSYYYCLPNKLFEYAMVGLPVIVSNLQEMKLIVEKYDMGIIVKEETIESINDSIERFLTLDMTQMKKNARKCAEEHSWEKQEIKMINEYKRILNGGE